MLFWSCVDFTSYRLLLNVLWTDWVCLGTRLEQINLVSDFGIVRQNYRGDLPNWYTKGSALTPPNLSPIPRAPAGNHPLRWPSCLYPRPGSDVMAAMTVVSEVGWDMSNWKTENYFVSRLTLCRTTKSDGTSFIVIPIRTLFLSILSSVAGMKTNIDEQKSPQRRKCRLQCDFRGR